MRRQKPASAPGALRAETPPGRKAVTPGLFLTAIVPVYNEQFLVRPSLERLAAIAGDPVLAHLKIVVVDDGSRDGSWAEIVRFARSGKGRRKVSIEAIRHERNQGKGAAIRTGVDHASGDVTVIHDADLEYDPRDLLAVARVFIEEDADAVFGSRFLAGPHRRVLYYHHELGNRFLTFCCNVLTNLNLTDMETCYKAIRTDLFRSIPIESDSFTLEPELAIKLAKRDAKLYEVPIRYAGRTYQEGKKIGWRDGLTALLAMIRFALSDNLYREDPHGSRILERMRHARRYNRWMADTLAPYCGSRVLEIGAGIGTLTAHLLPRSLYYATDINPEYLRRMAGSFANRPYARIAALDATDPASFPRPPGLFDTAICANVIEHIEDDVSVLRSIASVLASGGRALVLVPNGPGLYSSLDRVVGHCRRYDRATLARRCMAAGFAVERIIPFNRLGWMSWFINGKILNRHHFSRSQIWLLNFLTPLLRLVDGILPLPPLSLIAVLRRP